MKRMNEVFKDGVTTNFDFDYEWSAEDESENIVLSGYNPIASDGKVVLLAVASSKTYSSSSVDNRLDDIAAHTAHAINHVDAIADALADLIEESKNYAANFKSEYYSAIDALEDYRGEK